MANLREFLEPIAQVFQNLGVPEPVVHWGHPAMMAIVVFVMAMFVGVAGWRGRISKDTEVAQKQRAEHRKLAPWMFLFIALGYTGGVLSLVMQEQPIMESPHFWTGSTVLLLLTLNSALSLSGFGGNQKALRTTHAYLGLGILGLFILHAAFGLKLGLSI
jgi:hypothetical protein